ncbi:hypothetical protein KKP04_12050 [Rhodomicrobium sp. Az07]|uniref:hypothetical protein n=1 Tax=Rhodomicrobium sp. Az07 TaxID=2839034 RepID=UPI001BE67B04|nr:hypothetical protein [Rhodomicrobium sp. Az07]MBT3071598.1 hypothetical protein [Rhodomicrobium sp. Az07]
MNQAISTFSKFLSFFLVFSAFALLVVYYCAFPPLIVVEDLQIEWITIQSDAMPVLLLVLVVAWWFALGVATEDIELYRLAFGGSLLFFVFYSFFVSGDMFSYFGIFSIIFAMSLFGYVRGDMSGSLPKTISSILWIFWIAGGATYAFCLLFIPDVIAKIKESGLKLYLIDIRHAATAITILWVVFYALVKTILQKRPASLSLMKGALFPAQSKKGGTFRAILAIPLLLANAIAVVVSLIYNTAVIVTYYFISFGRNISSIVIDGLRSVNVNLFIRALSLPFCVFLIIYISKASVYPVRSALLADHSIFNIIDSSQANAGIIFLSFVGVIASMLLLLYAFGAIKERWMEVLYNILSIGAMLLVLWFMVVLTAYIFNLFGLHELRGFDTFGIFSTVCSIVMLVGVIATIITSSVTANNDEPHQPA